MTEQTAPRFQSGVHYEHFLDCVHCGLCTSSCPTYLELGTEMDSPRGRIHLMRAVTDGRLELTNGVQRHLELCLDCRSCETACPSGVQYGRLIEPFRVAMDRQNPHPKSKDWFHRWILFFLFPHAKRMRLALLPVRWMQMLGMDRLLERIGLLKLLPRQLRQMQAMLPRLARREGPLPERLPAKGPRRATVALLTGCVGEAVFHHTNWATARVLQENGCDVLVPRGQTCCGAIHYHAGVEGPAIERAITNAHAIDPDAVDAIIVNIAGCGAMLKDYPHLPVPAEHAQRIKKFASKVRDVCEFLVELGPIAPRGEIPLKATYHDACHLVHAQQVRSQPRELLGMIPGLQLVPLAESDICCGAAGTYNLTETEMAERLVARKTRNLADTGAQAVFIANAGCALHIGRRLRDEGNKAWIAHPVEVLDRSYRDQGAPAVT
jgi:glycolate oxidase iron-sulfur subunit